MRKSYIQVNGVLYEKGTEPLLESHYVIGDIKPYKSMVTGEMITSRAQHREHLIKHGCQEVGNEVQHHFSHYERMQKEVDARQKQSRVEILRAQFDEIPHRKLKEMVKRDVDFVKWNSRED